MKLESLHTDAPYRLVIIVPRGYANSHPYTEQDFHTLDELFAAIKPQVLPPPKAISIGIEDDDSFEDTENWPVWLIVFRHRIVPEKRQFDYSITFACTKIQDVGKGLQSPLSRVLHNDYADLRVKTNEERWPIIQDITRALDRELLASAHVEWP